MKLGRAIAYSAAVFGVGYVVSPRLRNTVAELTGRRQPQIPTGEAPRVSEGIIDVASVPDTDTVSAERPALPTSIDPAFYGRFPSKVQWTEISVPQSVLDRQALPDNKIQAVAAEETGGGVQLVIRFEGQCYFIPNIWAMPIPMVMDQLELVGRLPVPEIFAVAEDEGWIPIAACTRDVHEAAAATGTDINPSPQFAPTPPTTMLEPGSPMMGSNARHGTTFRLFGIF